MKEQNKARLVVLTYLVAATPFAFFAGPASIDILWGVGLRELIPWYADSHVGWGNFQVGFRWRKE